MLKLVGLPDLHISDPSRFFEGQIITLCPPSGLPQRYHPDRMTTSVQVGGADGQFWDLGTSRLVRRQEDGLRHIIRRVHGGRQGE
jgi:hypothetical protein